jgi:apolipoprotein N-acyltransferase
MISSLDQLATALPNWFTRQSLWRRRIATACAGALSVLAFAPFFFWPILWLTLPTLLWISDIEERTPTVKHRLMFWRNSLYGRAAEVGWWWGFGFFVVGLSWIGEAFLVEAEVFAWLLPFAVTLLPAGLALFMAAATAAASWLCQYGPHRVIALAAALGATEWLRGHILSGFPWNVLGYALTYPLPLMQFASIFGIYALTIVTVLSFAAPAVVWQLATRSSASQQKYRLRCAAATAASVPLVMLLIGIVWQSGAIRTYDREQSQATHPLIRIVQPSILQREKWRPENQRRIFDDHIALSLQNENGKPDGASGVSLIIWPEAAMPFRPLDTPMALAEIGRMLPDGATLVSGALRVTDTSPGTSQPRQVFNSLLAFGKEGRLIASYDKTHLVPFGEYLPLQRVLEAIGLQQLSKLRGGFTAGANPRPLMTIPAVGSLGPLICYEAIFPKMSFVNEPRPRAIINVTNDGWFGNSIGPRQHLHQARVRAVEQGLPLLRAANNGISAVIDPFGRIQGKLDLNVRGTIDKALPSVIAAPAYARWGDMPFFAFLLALLAWVLRSQPSAHETGK